MTLDAQIALLTAKDITLSFGPKNGGIKISASKANLECLESSMIISVGDFLSEGKLEFAIDHCVKKLK